MTATTERIAADDRGTLTIADSAVERIAAHAVTEVDGVGGAATRVLGVAVGGETLDRSAKVTATVTGGTATLAVRLSVGYPQSVRKTTETTRDHLTRRVGDLTGLSVERVDITVTALHTETAETRRVL
ncbi:Asp23/Gls24 family envelope stress response protein [Amycolatopsis sp., V23-08]|uniref:Asp23/Gls24 family envelope stress response protein n=1 Tax=Amycolatopsis heterodermiae TaxID=3110235 RepID=A0ABU5R9U7_9PSEU|nr:Asp23/Gls24 family envelope stress response protein [Amycolatopsis sp., V23-08]MEA5363002.1 Asp23/Gls24 family envelope stress response protein [Amycolatopsis sp., V23-08]